MQREARWMIKSQRPRAAKRAREGTDLAYRTGAGGAAAMDHVRALKTSSQLSERFRRMYNRGAVQVEPEAVVKVLNRAKVKFVLIGAHAVGGWTTEPRATRDVDVLVHRRHP